MEDTIIKFETAKLLKEKGFKPDNPSTDYIPMYYDNGNLSVGQEEDWDIDGRFLAPTQSLVQKWLREVHNIHINIKHRPHSQKFCFNITGNYQLGNDGELFSNIFSSYDTYELALEEGIKQALLLIK